MDHRDDDDVPSEVIPIANGSIRIPRSSFQLAGVEGTSPAETTPEDVRTPVTPAPADVGKHLSLHGSAAGEGDAY